MNFKDYFHYLKLDLQRNGKRPIPLQTDQVILSYTEYALGVFPCDLVSTIRCIFGLDFNIILFCQQCTKIFTYKVAITVDIREKNCGIFY